MQRPRPTPRRAERGGPRAGTPGTPGTVFPLLARFPSLGAIPRVALCTLPSPVQHVVVDGDPLWMKRDDLVADPFGGNKARVLEFLLAGVRPGDVVVTVGGEGSTQVLATATHAARLGARTIAQRWRHEMNPTATRVATLAGAACAGAPVARTAVGAIARAQWGRLARRGHVHYVPLGGSTPLGALAHVNAALELAAQVTAGLLPPPARLVVALGSGGTMAGLALGCAIAGLETGIIGVQVTPAIVANRLRVRRLVTRTARLIERHAGVRVPRPGAQRMAVVRGAYGGAYGRPLAAGVAAARVLERDTGIRVDQTYTAKALAVALAIAHESGADAPTLFWNTFDGRVLS